ncbi:ATP-grasp ribosomal peptide maturase [Streptomyces sp. NPDC006186]|jgi:ATP-grasp ribosomal peptide maturase|uniref:ATP-grasp ribosomal peptide maturase n=1 Tax=Streptomyces sp. NPDC006186 TaxID=3155248 RepID=UPI0033A37BB8
MTDAVLVVTALDDVTADWVIAALNRRAVPVVRVDPADIGTGLSFRFCIGAEVDRWEGRLSTPSRDLQLSDVAAVYYRRPTPYAQRFRHVPRQQKEFVVSEARHGLSGVLNSLDDVLYVNHPWAVAQAEFKPAQLRRFAALGLRVPPTLVTNEAEAAREFAQGREHVVYKTFRGLPRSDDGISGAIWAQRVSPQSFDDSLSVTAHLFQSEIPKAGDARVTVVGPHLFAQRVATRDGALDWRRGDWSELIHTPITVPSTIEAALRNYLASFGLVFGCFDFALTGDGEHPEDWWVLECNPNGQWGWLPDAPAITEAFADVLCTDMRQVEGAGTP